MAAQLTSNACTRLRNAADYHIIVCSPVLRVVNVTGAAATLFGFNLDKAATLVDDTADCEPLRVFFPSGRAPFGSSADFPRELRAGDVVQLQKLVRIPAGDETIIVVWDVEVCTDDDVPLEVTNYESTISDLTAQLERTRSALETMTKPHFAEPLLETVTTIIVGLHDLIDRSAA